MSTTSHSNLNMFRFETHLDTFPTGGLIFGEGEEGQTMYVVKDGEVDIVVRGKVVETVGPGGILGEMALIDKNPRSASAIAKTDCSLVSISEDRFKYLIRQNPFFALEVMRVMADRLRRMDAQP